MQYSSYDINMAQKMKRKFDRSGFQPICEIGSIEEIMLKMSDGTKLQTVIYKPDTPPPYSVIITRTCYTMYDKMMSVHAEEFCRRGYAYIYQYTRGISKSEGTWVPNIYEYGDSIDTFKWLDAQIWCKNFGYYGFSYGCYSGLVSAEHHPPKMKTLFLSHFGIDRYSTLYRHGMFKMDFITNWVMRNAGVKIDADLEESCKFLPHYEVDEKLWNTNLPWYRDWVSNTHPECPCWKETIWDKLDKAPQNLRIPIFIGSAWFDHHLYGTSKLFHELNPEVRAHSHFRIGAWTHFFRNNFYHENCSNIGNNDIIPALKWYDRLLLKDELPERKISLYVIGADKWLDFKEYPVDTGKSVKFFLSSKDENGVNTIATKNPAVSESVHYVYNPKNPVTSVGGSCLMASHRALGSVLQPEVNYREDVISFVSQPLESFEIMGKVKLDLYVSSDAEDTSFSAKISEIMPDGKTYNIRSYITSLEYITNEQKLGEYLPNSIIKLEIEFDDVAWKIQNGSKLRLDISSSDFMQFNAHTNYKGIWSLQRESKPALQGIYYGEQYECKLEIPIL